MYMCIHFKIYSSVLLNINNNNNNKKCYLRKLNLIAIDRDVSLFFFSPNSNNKLIIINISVFLFIYLD